MKYSLACLAFLCLAATTITQTTPVVPLRWEDATDLVLIDGYRVERRDGTASHWQVLTEPPLPPATRRYTDTTVQPGQTYCYRVAQIALGGKGVQYATNAADPTQREVCLSLPMTLATPTGLRIEPPPTEPPPSPPQLGPELLPSGTMESHEWGHWASDRTTPGFVWTEQAYQGRRALEINPGTSTTRIRGGYGSALIPIDPTKAYQISVARTFIGVQQMRILALWRSASDGDVMTTVIDELTDTTGSTATSNGWGTTTTTLGPYTAAPHIAGLRIHLYCTIVPVLVVLAPAPPLAPPPVDLVPLPTPPALGAPSQWCRWDDVSVRAVLTPATP